MYLTFASSAFPDGSTGFTVGEADVRDHIPAPVRVTVLPRVLAAPLLPETSAGRQQRQTRGRRPRGTRA